MYYILEIERRICMNGNCHFIFGAATASAVVMNLDKISLALPVLANDSATATLIITSGLLGSIFPDIDNPTSHMGKLSYPVSHWISELNAFSGKTKMYHRGVLHDAGVYMIALFLCYLYFPPLCGFFLGCLSHVFLDMFNPVGVPFLLGKRNLHLGKVKSGSKASVILTWICVIGVLTLGICIHLGLSLM